MWWGPRLGRGDFFFAILALNAAYLAAASYFSGGLFLSLAAGMRSAPALWGVQPIWVTLLGLGVDFVMASLISRRLQDADYPGWYFLGWIALLWGVSLVPGLGLLALVIGLAALLAPFFLKPIVGPNRFGPDPRGWKSKEHFQEQEDRLKSGDI